MNAATVSIVIPTLGRTTLYPLIENLLKQRVDFDYEIVLIPQVALNEGRWCDERIRIFPEPPGRGFAYYRNAGMRRATGGILVFIDDDEWPMDLHWLKTLTDPIVRENEMVTTAGIRIELGQGYWTDCISLLGFPGGGAVGFETMWKVYANGYTEHLCSGNCAIHKTLLAELGGFDVELVYGNEDVGLARSLAARGVRIRYVESATVHHAARRGFSNFMKWNILRGKSAQRYLVTCRDKSKVSDRFASSLRVLARTVRQRPANLLGVILLMCGQYLMQTLAFLKSR